jgi:GNAT superfamily N-acetyltransferase
LGPGNPVADAGYRVNRYLRKYGVRAAGTRVVDAARQRALLDETHVWYELSLRDGRPRVDLAPGFVFRRAEPSEVALIEQLPTVARPEAQRRLDAGNDLWFVLDGDTPAFACWIFRQRMPMLAAPGGVLELPPGSVCLEDSVTSADYRGRGLAPAAWTLLADVLEHEGVGSMLTKVGEENTPSRRAVTKAGFVEIGVMHFRRVGPRSRTTMREPGGNAGRWLSTRLNP